ncbi:MAG: transposase family protein [Candidatus Marinimicrobia bacterium]|nr:transposase family protein [Candidatus Neomarinimicrobiota bacterium]
MRLAMSFKTRRELLVHVIPRYREADRNQKKYILDEFVSTTGYSRKYAIRLLSSKKLPMVSKICRPRVPYYGTEDQEIIKLAWSAANFIASKRLAPFLKELIPALERHGYLNLIDKTRDKIISISSATIDRILAPQRKHINGRGISTTKPGALLKKQIPIRTFADWTENKPGFFEADLVAHCGGDVSGAFLYTLVLTDVTTGWVECLPLLSKHQGMVIQAFGHALKLIPFPILGIDTDNGSEFINEELIDFCEQYQITFTRGRAYKKNDQCFVEQKNGVVVRQIVGYDRFEGMVAYKQLNELYRATRLYVNFFQPSMKLRIKHRDGAKVRRTYDPAKTPFHRLLSENILSGKKQKYLENVYDSLDPIRLLHQIKRIQDALWKHSVNNISIVPNEKCPVTFNSQDCIRGQSENLNAVAVEFMNKSLEHGKRKYRRTKKTRVPHTWRTVPNPFEDVWDEAVEWLEVAPERTAKSIFEDLQSKYPGKFKDGQLRTVQRHVKAWRAEAILTFDYKWLNEELLAEDKFTAKFQGKVIREAVL